MGEIAESNFSNYEAYRQELGREVSRVAESFVRIGYLLKVARDTNILEGSKYSNYLDFAAGEYGLDKTTVSRFININSRFSVGGNSNTILPQYAEYGRAQLQEMLLLPDAITEELNPSMTKTEIAEIKKEYQEEEKISDIEVLLEPVALPELTLFEKIIREYLRTDKELYEKVYEACKKLIKTPTEDNISILKEVFIPNEEKIVTIRISGTGRLLVHFEGKKITATNMRSSEKTEHEWEQVLQGVCYSVNTEVETVEQSYRWAYGEPLEENHEVAPVQHTQNVTESTQNAEKAVEKVENTPHEEPENRIMTECEPIQSETAPAVHEESAKKEENIPPQKAENRITTPCEPVPQQQAEEVSEYEAELAGLDRETIVKELIMCANQLSIEARHMNEIEDIEYRIRRAREELEKFDIALIEIERRYK